MMKAEVAKAVQALRNYFATLRVDVVESPCGGAWVLIHDVPLGAPYVQETTWIGFFITNACPHADTYPFYVRPDLSRRDGAALRVPLHVNHQWLFGPSSAPPQPAVMVSRRQSHAHCLGRETPLIKLQTVLKWMLEQ